MRFVAATLPAATSMALLASPPLLPFVDALVPLGGSVVRCRAGVGRHRAAIVALGGKKSSSSAKSDTSVGGRGANATAVDIAPSPFFMSPEEGEAVIRAQFETTQPPEQLAELMSKLGHDVSEEVVAKKPSSSSEQRPVDLADGTTAAAAEPSSEFRIKSPEELAEIKWKLGQAETKSELSDLRAAAAKKRRELLRRNLLGRSMRDRRERPKIREGGGAAVDDDKRKSASKHHSSTTASPAADRNGVAKTRATRRGVVGVAVKDARLLVDRKRRSEMLQRQLLERRMREWKGPEKSKVGAAAEEKKRRVEMLQRKLLERRMREGKQAERRKLGAAAEKEEEVKVKAKADRTLEARKKSFPFASKLREKAARGAKDIEAVLASIRGAEEAVQGVVSAKANAAEAASEQMKAADSVKKGYELQVDRLNMKILRLTGRLERTRGESESKLVTLRDEARTEKSRLEATIAELSVRNAALLEEVEGIESQLTGARAGARSLWSNFVEARRKMTAQLDEARDDVARVMEEARANATVLEATSAGLRADLETSEGRVAGAEGRVEELRKELKGLERSSREEKERDLKESEGRLKSQFKKRAEKLVARARHFARRLKTTKAASNRHAQIIRSKANAHSQELEEEIGSLRLELEDATSELLFAHEQARREEEATDAVPEESEKVEALAVQVGTVAEHLRTVKIESNRNVTLARAKGFAASKVLEKKIASLTVEMEEAKVKLEQKEEDEKSLADQNGDMTVAEIPAVNKADASVIFTSKKDSKQVEELTAEIEEAAAKLKALEEETERKVKLVREEALKECTMLEEQLTVSRKELESAKAELSRAVDDVWNVLENQVDLDAARRPIVAPHLASRLNITQGPEASIDATDRAADCGSLAAHIRSLTDDLRTAKVESKSMLLDVQMQARMERDELEDQIISLTVEAEEANLKLAHEMDVSHLLRLDLNKTCSTMTAQLVVVREEHSRQLKEMESTLRKEIHEVEAVRMEERREFQQKMSMLDSELVDARAEVERLRAELGAAKRAALQAPRNHFPQTAINSIPQPLSNGAAPVVGMKSTTMSPEEAAEEARIAARRLTEFLTGDKKAITVAERTENEVRLAAERLNDSLSGSSEPVSYDAATFQKPVEQSVTGFQATAYPRTKTEYRYTVEYENGARDVDLRAKVIRAVDPNVRELTVGTTVEVMSFFTGALVTPWVSMSRQGGVGGKGNRRQRGVIVGLKPSDE